MLDPAWGRALADLGGFALFLFGVVGLAIALFKRWIVMGWTYDREAARADKSEAREEKLAAAVEKLAKSHDRRSSARTGPPDVR